MIGTSAVFLTLRDNISAFQVLTREAYPPLQLIQLVAP